MNVRHACFSRRLARSLPIAAVAVCGSLFYAPSPAAAQRSPEDELQSLQAPPGFEISLFASEPMITNPSAIDVDTEGRVWVAEIQWYRSKARNPPADKIKVLEDTDGDGRADKVTVFAEGVFAPMSICVAGDKVYVATSPDLWVYEDKNGDLKADGPPEKLLTGFGGLNHDHGAHSLVLGPDHKWWMSHGDTGFNVTGKDGSHIEFKWGGMLRGELDGTKLEAVAVNFRNPYEICVSSFGEAFCSDNDNDGNFSVRICWILEGGNYGWFGGPPAKVPPGTPFGEHWHFRGHIPGFVPATLVTGFGSPCGICFYEGDEFGAEFKNAPLHTDSGPREVRIYRHEASGAGMKATSRVFVSSADDNYFRPDDICTAPDGTLYLSDWYDGGVGGHAYNNPDQGRIFQLKPAGKKPVRVGKPGPFASVDDAIEGLKNPNLATQFLARERLLAHGQASVKSLKTLLADSEPNYRARAMWLLDRLGGQARAEIVAQLQNSDDALRALAVRILRRHGVEFATEVLAMASDPSAEVRREVLLAMPKLPAEMAQPVLVNLAAGYDGADRYLLEAINVAAGERKASLYAALDQAGLATLDRIQLLQVLDPSAAATFLTRSLAATDLDDAARAVLLAHLGGTASAEAGQAVLKLAAGKDTPADLRRLSIRLLAANLAGNWQGLKQQPELAAGLRRLLANADWQVDSLAVVGNNNLADLGPDALGLAQSEDASAEARVKAIEVVAQLRVPECGADLESLLKSPIAAVKQAALAALVDLQDWNAAKRLLADKNASTESQTDVVQRMMASAGGALVLLKLIDEQTMPKAVAAAAIALATQHPDSNVRVLYEKFIPEDQRPQRLGSVIKAEQLLSLPGDAARGQQIFFRSSAAQCKNCHRAQGVGGAVGPDLSQIGRKYERGALLDTILDPSKAIAPEFIAYLLETSAGQVYAGFLVERTDDHVVLKDATAKLITVPTAEIEALEPQKKSLMPELVLRDVTAQDAADLLAFMMSLNEAVQSVTRFRAMGPFASPDKQGIDHDFGPEAAVARPDLNASFPGAENKPRRWEIAETDFSKGFAAVDQVKQAQVRGVPAEGVTNYYLVFADSAADQDATLQLGSDDSCKVWVNGEQIHVFRGDRAVGQGDDKLKVRLHSGRNPIVVKVENHQGPGGVSLAIGSAGAVELKTE